MNFIFSFILLINFLRVHVECIQQGDFISITEAPYYASLFTPGGGPICGAAIVSEYWLVSAGHCVQYDSESTKVRTGATSRSENGIIHTIDRVVLPDNYTRYTSDLTSKWAHINDISLIKLKEPITFDEYQQPIKLYPSPAKVNDTIVIVGLGRERVQQISPSLKKTSHLVAATAPPFFLNPASVFHLRNSTSHLCPGDSGSPGVIDNQLAGVASFVDEMCRDWEASHENKYPGALTRIDMFYNWILEHTGIRIQQGDFISITEAPYFASLVEDDKKAICGASIISEYWIVSAAHCVKYGYRWIKVRTGATTMNGNGSVHAIENVVIHSNFSSDWERYYSVNDISLIKLKEPITFNEYQQPIKIRSSAPKENDTVIIVGLGLEQVEQTPPSLKKTVQYVAGKAPPGIGNPPSVYHLKNGRSHLCPGDSGSPGVIDGELAGIESFGAERCKSWQASHEDRYSGSQTRVDLFYDWILEQTGIKY